MYTLSSCFCWPHQKSIEKPFLVHSGVQRPEKTLKNCRPMQSTFPTTHTIMYVPGVPIVTTQDIRCKWSSLRSTLVPPSRPIHLSSISYLITTSLLRIQQHHASNETAQAKTGFRANEKPTQSIFSTASFESPVEPLLGRPEPAPRGQLEYQAQKL